MTATVHSGVKLPKNLKIFSYKETSSPKEDDVIVASTNYYHHGKSYIVESSIEEADFVTLKSMRSCNRKNNGEVYSEKRHDISTRGSFFFTQVENSVAKIGDNIYVVL